MRRSWKETAGFTLVELIVVIAILGILAGVAVPTYSGYVKKANEAADNQLLMAVNTAFTSACIDQGEFDTTRLAVPPKATIDPETGVIELNEEYDDGFQRYFANSGVFKYFNKLYFVPVRGIFMSDASLKEVLQEALADTPFAVEQTMEQMMLAFDQVGYYFGEMGFSLDALVAAAPAEVQEAFGFGTFDLTDEQILKKYVSECANMTGAQIEEYKATLSDDQMNTIRGNAYVMHMASDANGRSAATVMSDVNNLMSALATPVDNDDVVAYYKKINNIPENEDVSYETARDALKLQNVDGSDYMVVQVATSGVKNTSGVSTLGSMYALAAGFYSNTEYYKGSASDIPNFANFEDTYMDQEKGVMSTANAANFQRYLAEQAEKDIGAYLSAMSYLSTGNFNMGQTGVFSGKDPDGDAVNNSGYDYIWGALGN